MYYREFFPAYVFHPHSHSLFSQEISMHLRIRNHCKAAFIIPLCFSFFACTQIENASTGSIIFNIDSSIAKRAVDEKTIEEEPSQIYIKVQLNGDYDETITKPLPEDNSTEALTFSFLEIPVGSSIFATAEMYTNLPSKDEAAGTETIEKYVYWKGISETITITSGENSILVKQDPDFAPAKKNQSDIIITVEPLPDSSDIEVSIEDLPSGTFPGKKFTAPAGYSSYIWKVNGEIQTEVTGNVFEFNMSSIPAGLYDITLLVSNDTANLSWHAQVIKN